MICLSRFIRFGLAKRDTAANDLHGKDQKQGRRLEAACPRLISIIKTASVSVFQLRPKLTDIL